jgi:hypothetical protein
LNVPICIKKQKIGLQAVPQRIEESSDEEFPMLAYMLAIFLPLIGFFFGVYLMAKNNLATAV